MNGLRKEGREELRKENEVGVRMSKLGRKGGRTERGKDGRRRE